jgi:hypothetical protein
VDSLDAKRHCSARPAGLDVRTRQASRKRPIPGQDSSAAHVTQAVANVFLFFHNGLHNILGATAYVFFRQLLQLLCVIDRWQPAFRTERLLELKKINKNAWHLMVSAIFFRGS